MPWLRIRPMSRLIAVEHALRHMNSTNGMLPPLSKGSLVLPQWLGLRRAQAEEAQRARRAALMAAEQGFEGRGSQ